MDVKQLMRHMHELAPDIKRLSEIQTVYDNLTLLGQLLGAGTDITKMRNDFNALADVLLEQLASEHMKKVSSKLLSDAQIAINVLIRNLYERSADIGFIAKDELIKELLLCHEQDQGVTRNISWQIKMYGYLSEYVTKYTVYDDVIILSSQGEVIHRLKENIPTKRSQDRLIGESLTTEQRFVETFRTTDLDPLNPYPLIFSFRVMSDEGQTLGVVCLSFRFLDECEKIFNSLLSPSDWTVLTIMDASGQVISSSDQHQIPLGARLTRPAKHAVEVIRFRGREYLSTASAATPYEGYVGPGWYGQALVPLEHAFDGEAISDEAGDRATLCTVAAISNVIHPTLRETPLRAEWIQQELNRAVWNGNIWLFSEEGKSSTQFARVLLREIGRTGSRTRSVFSESTDNLFITVIRSILLACTIRSALAIEILDRNLYERSNDCRWWALNPALRDAVLPNATADTLRKAATVLVEMNQLYTVYSNVVLFDQTGRVIAVSSPVAQGLNGHFLAEEWSKSVMSLPDTQSYYQSNFAENALYGGQKTYMFCAALRDTQSSKPIGGIALVFDAKVQLHKMLLETLPRDELGVAVEGAIAAYVDFEGRVLASANELLPVGERLTFLRDFLLREESVHQSAVIEFQGRFYALGICASSGYREYTQSEELRSKRYAVMLYPISDPLEQSKPIAAQLDVARDFGFSNVSLSSKKNMHTADIATFYIGSSWFGLNPRFIVSAIDVAELTPIPGCEGHIAGCLMFQQAAITVVNISGIVNSPLAENDRRKPRSGMAFKNQVLILQSSPAATPFGLLIDGLGEIAEIDKSRVEAVPAMMADGHSLIDSLIKPAENQRERRILVVLSVERMLSRFGLIGG